MDKDFTARRYGYGLLERSLGAALDADEEVQRGALRSRIKRLARLGLPAPLLEAQEGRRAYSLEEAHQLLVAILMEDAGLDPTVVAPAVNKVWKNNLAKGAVTATNKDAQRNPILLKLTLQTIIGPWRTGDPAAAVPIIKLLPRLDERAIDRYRTKHKVSLETALRWADEVLYAYGSLQETDGALVLRNYTAKAIKLEDVLKEGK
jgi:hypothetical protein